MSATLPRLILTERNQFSLSRQSPSLASKDGWLKLAQLMLVIDGPLSWGHPDRVLAREVAAIVGSGGRATANLRTRGGIGTGRVSNFKLNNRLATVYLHCEGRQLYLI
jgi:hypothetical protein